ncbi:MAG TPA: hypothetical protein VK841_09515 [Polyangiaceae bacterium]|jgi:hypothetical protein|nr:hypothetical protein [Polyangiaceae bacterium]
MATKKTKKTRRERIVEMLENNAIQCEKDAEDHLAAALSRLRSREDVEDVISEIDAAVANLFQARGHRNAACDVREKADV